MVPFTSRAALPEHAPLSDDDLADQILRQLPPGGHAVKQAAIGKTPLSATQAARLAESIRRRARDLNRFVSVLVINAPYVLIVVQSCDEW